VANGKAFVPLTFELGEAFQFDWSEEGLVIGALMATSNSPTCGHSNSPRQDVRIMGFLTPCALIAMPRCRVAA
jgi:hypothetical protein